MYDDNLRPSEFGQGAPEQQSTGETRVPREAEITCEIPPVREFSTTEPLKKRRDKRATVKKATATITAMLATVGVVGTITPAITESIYAASPITIEDMESNFEEDVFSFYFLSDSKELKTAVLYNDFTDKRYELTPDTDEYGNHYNGYFEGLKPGVKYDFRIMAEGTFGERVVYSETIVGPHAIDSAYAVMNDYGVDGTVLYCFLDVYEAVPLQIAFTGRGVSQTIPLVDGENELQIEGIVEGATYTWRVFGEGLFGKEVTVAVGEIRSPHPIEWAEAVLTSYDTPSPDTIEYNITVYSDVPLRAVLTDGTNTYTKDLVDGENDGSFTGLASDTTYTLTVVGEDADGHEVILLTESIYIPPPLYG